MYIAAKSILSSGPELRSHQWLVTLGAVLMFKLNMNEYLFPNIFCTFMAKQLFCGTGYAGEAPHRDSINIGPLIHVEITNKW